MKRYSALRGAMDRMLILRLAIRNLARRPKRSLALLAIMAAAVFLLFTGNAVFDGTSAGIAQSFLRSFTGDLVIRARDIESNSLFGNETAVTGRLAKLPELVPSSELKAYLSTIPQIRMFTTQISGMVFLQTRTMWLPAPLFGIAGETYFSTLDGILISKGRALVAGERGMLISEARARDLERINGNPTEIGQTIQFTAVTDSSFRTRALPLVGITHYPVQNATLDNIILVDAQTLRSLLGMGIASSTLIAAPQAAVSMLAGSVDELFTDASADTSSNGEGLDRKGIEEQLSKPVAAAPVDPEAGPWHYLILRLVPGSSTEKMRLKLNDEFRNRGWPLEAIGWREAAGSGALFVYWLRIIFNIGVVVVAFAGLIVVMNALVSGVLERTGEIGTMRALGAQRGFVSRLFALETTALALTAGILGTAMGMILVALLSRHGLRISNSFLIQLFGGPVLRPAFDAGSVFRALAASILIGSLAWIYPVHLALKVNPIEAMRRRE